MRNSLPRVSIILGLGRQRPQIGEAMASIGIDRCTEALHILPGPRFVASLQQSFRLIIADEVDEEQGCFDGVAYCYRLQRVGVRVLPVTSQGLVRAQPGGCQYLVRPDRYRIG